MDGRREVEVISLLEDAIGELSCAFIVGTGKNEKPKLLYQISNFVNNKKTEKNMRVLSDSQVKLLVENTKAMNILTRAMDVYQKREKIMRQFDARIYACKAHSIHINSKKERAGFQIAAYSRINELNNQHFEHMIIQNHSTIDEYYRIIENYMSSLETVYIEELSNMITSFDIKHGNDVILRAEEVEKYFGSEESYRIRLDSKKSKVVGGIFKNYGDFIDRIDKQAQSLESKEVVPARALEYKFQYLIAKTRIMEIINRGMKNINVPSKLEKSSGIVSKITKRISTNKQKYIGIDSKKRNEVCVRKMTDEIENIVSNYRNTIKELKSKNKMDSKLVRKLQKSNNILNEGINVNSKVIIKNDANAYKKQLEVVLEDRLDNKALIRQFLITKLEIPQQFVSNPVIIETLANFIEKYNVNAKDGSKDLKSNFEKLKSNIHVEFSNNEVAFYQGESKLDETKKRVIVRNNLNQVFVTESTESPVILDERISNQPIWEVNTNTRIYDGETNIEMSRLVRRALLDANRNEVQVLESSVYKRNTENLNYVIKENDNTKRDISITPEDIATLDGAVRPSYKLCESSRKTTVRAIANKRILENTEPTDNKEDVLKKVEEEIAKDTIERKIKESKFKSGFLKYPKYSYLKHEVEHV